MQIRFYFNLLLVSSVLLSNSTFSQSLISKREFRGAWIATVTNLDWPSFGSSVQKQKDDLIALLDQLAFDGINAVILQIRPECDAFYQSPYEPWSYWLTGNQGSPPIPFYDPLQFAVEEAHKRGMEIHAWFNPYRAERSVGNYSLASNHVSIQHPDWSFIAGSLKMLNPGLREVREWNVKVITDVVRRYDIDGVHMDDYFYPYPPNAITNQDYATFTADPRGFTNIADWRRDNVNLLIKMIYDSIQQVKPWVKFGMSPFGIWKNGVPSGISGLDAYSTIYCDAVQWLQAKTIDYITPQLYWGYGGGQDYAKLQPWWATQLNGRHFYPGLATYSVSANTLCRQIRQGRELNNAQGSIQFRASNIIDNRGGIADSLKKDIFRYPAIIPTMIWKDTIPTGPPKNLRFEKIPSSSVFAFQWDAPEKVSGQDTAYRYSIYRFTSLPMQSDFSDPKYLLSIAGNGSAFPPSGENQQYYFAVSALDRNYNESAPSNFLSIIPPYAPVLAYPPDGEQYFAQNQLLQWRHSNYVSFNLLQVATTQDFSTGTISISTNVADSSANVQGLLGEQKYYWRLKSFNPAGMSDFSSVWSFTTGWPSPVKLALPKHGDSTSLNPTFSWAKGFGQSWQIQVSTPNFPGTIVVDTTISDTFFVCSRTLEPKKIYRWRVKARNSYGTGDWSQIFGFITKSVLFADVEQQIPSSYELSQNYPNPFNPTTTIRFAIPQSGHITLRVYDLIGREVLELANDNLPAGRHSVVFNGNNLSSGVYIYMLQANGVRLIKRMTLIK
jgi:uncharacterized lipoprotein YddW (UPF0748 family)